METPSGLRAWTHDLTGYFIYLLFVATLGPLLFGYHLAELNAPQDVITCVKKSIDTDSIGANLPQCIPMNPTQLGLVSSIFTLGGLIGALAAGPLTSRYGRLIGMRTITAFFALGPVAEALAPNIGTMTLGRFVSGLGAGAGVVIVPIYISEISPPRQKGLFGAFTQIMTNLGILITQVLGYFLSRGQLWRVILAIGGAIGLLQLMGLSLAIESPKWQADHGRPRAAKEGLQRIRGHNVDIKEEVAGWGLESENLIEEEQQTLLDEADRVSHHSSSSPNSKMLKQSTLGIFGILRSPEHHRAIIAVVLVMAAQQFCGINSIVMYGVSLLSSLLQSSSALLNIFVSITNLVITTLCSPLPDRFGRKPTLLASIAGMGTSSVLLGIGIQRGLPTLSAVAVLLFVASFGLGLGPVPFILSSELVGPEAVGATQSWALAANWVATFVVAQFFPVVNDWLPKGTVYYIFAALAAGFFLLIWALVPETRGKSSMDEVWGRGERRED